MDYDSQWSWLGSGSDFQEKTDSDPDPAIKKQSYPYPTFEKQPEFRPNKIHQLFAATQH